MNDDMRDLDEQVEEMERQAEGMRQAMLQAQERYHRLFAVLNTLQWLRATHRESWEREFDSQLEL
jgi:sensor histidine kinase YesM